MRGFFRNRLYVMIVISAILACILAVQSVNTQLVKGSYYRQIADNRMYNTTEIKAPRGEIVDRYGKTLVSNKAAYSIIINYKSKTKKELNNTLVSLLKICDENGYVYEDGMPISKSEPYEYTFEEEKETKQLAWKKSMELDSWLSAQQVIEKLAEEYEVDLLLDTQTKRRLIGLRYDMQQCDFSRRNPYSFISDIDISLVSKIKENLNGLEGIEVVSEPVRQYTSSGIAAHILGQVGKINAEEYKQLSENGYGYNDTLGKDGLEKYLEPYLRGKDGTQSNKVQINNEEVTLVENVPAVPGNRAILTIDSNVQAAAEDALATAVANMRAAGASQIQGAAAVAIEVNSGEVLAIANYPTYDPAQFRKDYSKLINNPLKPMFNRAISGAYQPGSTFKPLTAIAGLEEGVISGNELIDCNGPYMFYAPSYTPACWIYNDYGGKHEHINVSKALEVSCNIFFFETSRRLGIEKLNDYGKQFGLGELTGIEIAGEEDGVLAGPQNREAAGGIWYPGDTIQASIGQSDNMFTPLQMANYIATVANGGTRYAPHLVKSIVSPDGLETVVSFEPKILNTVDINPENLKLVHAGMRSVVETTSKTSFETAKYNAAGKTGTAQTSLTKTPHSWFVSFAPAEKPQVAIAVVVEHGGINGLGGHVSLVARKMFDAYFFSNQSDSFSMKNTLIN